MKRSPACLLDGRVQELLQRLQLALHRNNAEEAIKVLPGLQALAAWQRNRTLAKLLALLARALAGLRRAPEEQHRQWLLHAFRLLQAVDGPRSRLALLSSRLPSAGTAAGNAARRFMLGLPATHASWPQQAEARGHLQTWLQQELQDLAEACGNGTWELQDCLATGRGARLRRMTQLASFLGQEEAETFALLELLVILLHGLSAPPPEAGVLNLQKLIWRLSLGRPVKQGLLDLLGGLLPGRDQSAASEPGQEPGCEEVQQGLQILQDWCRQHEDDAGLHVSEAALFESGRLAWVLLALEATLIGTLLQVMHRVFTDFWYLHRPLPGKVVSSLGDMLRWLAAGRTQRQDTGASFLLLGHWLGSLVAAWPQQVGGEERLLREVRVQDVGGQLLPPRLPADLPAQLAARLHVIPAREPLWCRDLAGWQSQGAELVHELLLLEQGAAALRLAPLERYCASLLDVLHLLPLHPEFPAALLQEARECLLHMLDRAALWLAPVPDASHVAALRQWLSGFAERVPQALQEGAAQGGERWLRLEIEQLLRPAADILDRSLRVEVQSMELVLPRTSCTALLGAIQVLLRWLLSCSEADTRERRERGRPQAMRVTLCVEPSPQVSAAPDWQVRLFDADGSVLPDQRQLARLARKAGLAQVCCRVSAGEGREFSLHPHSLGTE